MAKNWHRDIEVAWRDMDAFGHVNNVAFARYLEDARIRWMELVQGDLAAAGGGPVIVNLNLNYRRELVYPATVRVTLVAELASEKRLVLRHTIVAIDDPQTLYADAEVTLLWIDFDSRRSAPWPRRLSDALAEG
jgi:acyl-CoA thioester hydrolase